MGFMDTAAESVPAKQIAPLGFKWGWDRTYIRAGLPPYILVNRQYRLTLIAKIAKFSMRN